MISKTALKHLKEAFLGEAVIVFLRDMNVVVPTPDGGSLTTSVMIEGIVVDIDQDFIFLGTEDGTVTKTISHDAGPMIELMSQAINEYDVLFPGEFDGNTH